MFLRSLLISLNRIVNFTCRPITVDVLALIRFVEGDHDTFTPLIATASTHRLSYLYLLLLPLTCHILHSCEIHAVGYF